MYQRHVPRRQTHVETDRTPSRRLKIFGSVALGIAAVIFLASFFAFSGDTYQVVHQPLAAPPPIPPGAPGKETVARPGCELSNGHQVCNNADGSQILSFYKMTGGQIGDAITDYDPIGRRQVFRAFIIGYDPNLPDPSYRTAAQNLGQEDMTMNSRIPRNDLPAPHPAVAAYLISLQSRGVDLPRMFGGMISEPICDPLTRECVQWAEKAKFKFREEAQSPTQVSLAELGQLRVPSLPAPQQPQPVVQTLSVIWYTNARLIVGYFIALVFLIVGIVFFRMAGTMATQETSNTSRPGRLR